MGGAGWGRSVSRRAAWLAVQITSGTALPAALLLPRLLLCLVPCPGALPFRPCLPGALPWCPALSALPACCPALAALPACLSAALPAALPCAAALPAPGTKRACMPHPPTSVGEPAPPPLSSSAPLPLDARACKEPAQAQDGHALIHTCTHGRLG